MARTTDQHNVAPARRTRRNLALVIAAVGLPVLGGCAGQLAGVTADTGRSVSYQDRLPIKVSRATSTLRVPVGRTVQGLSGPKRAQISRFLQVYKDRGAGKLRVSRPVGTPNQYTASATVGQISQMIDRIGVPRESIILSAYQPSGKRANAPIILSYIRYTAKAAPCGDWSTNLAVTYRNRPYPNFGCATQANLAAVVANPGDLVKPRTMTPPDAIRRDNTFELYRKGEVTAAQKSDEEKAKVSTVGDE